MDAKLGWLTEPFAGTCITRCEKVRALAPHAVWVSDNPLGKKVDFSSKALSGRCLVTFGVRGAARSLRQGICKVWFGGVWLSWLRACFKKRASHVPGKPKLMQKAQLTSHSGRHRDISFSGMRFEGIVLRIPLSGPLCGHSFWQPRPQVQGLAQKAARARGKLVP